MIKDSGTRREFSTGAVRDIQEGKGRCDLMPLSVVGKWLEMPFLRHMAQVPVHGVKALEMAFYALIDEMYDGDAANATLELSKQFEEGAKKYGEHNWQKGIPVNCYVDSAVRHYLKWARGDHDEPHDRAALWNVVCCAWEVLQKR